MRAVMLNIHRPNSRRLRRTSYNNPALNPRTGKLQENVQYFVILLTYLESAWKML